MSGIGRDAGPRWRWRKTTQLKSRRQSARLKQWQCEKHKHCDSAPTLMMSPTLKKHWQCEKHKHCDSPTGDDNSTPN